LLEFFVTTLGVEKERTTMFKPISCPCKKRERTKRKGNHLFGGGGWWVFSGVNLERV